MEQPALWEMIAVGALVLLLLFFMRGGIAASLQRSREAESKDWGALLLPLAAVVLFVMLLIALAR